jgi:hypothetical protein
MFLLFNTILPQNFDSFSARGETGYLTACGRASLYHGCQGLGFACARFTAKDCHRITAFEQLLDGLPLLSTQPWANWHMT